MLIELSSSSITDVVKTKDVLLLLLCLVLSVALAYTLNLLHRDPLTQVLNRRGFFTMAPLVTSRPHYAALALDIDWFKSINDTYGHEVGDAVLRLLAEKIRSAVRQHLAPNAVVARFGGEEFMLLLPMDEKAAKKVADCIRRLVATTDFAIGRRVTLSIGVAGARPKETLDEVLRHADVAAYQAKREGRNRVCSWTDQDAPSSRRSRLRASERPVARRDSRLLRVLGRTSRTIWRLSPHRLLLPPMGVIVGNLRNAAQTRRPARRIIRTLVRAAALVRRRPRKNTDQPRNDQQNLDR